MRGLIVGQGQGRFGSLSRTDWRYPEDAKVHAANMRLLAVSELGQETGGPWSLGREVVSGRDAAAGVLKAFLQQVPDVSLPVPSVDVRVLVLPRGTFGPALSIDLRGGFHLSLGAGLGIERRPPPYTHEALGDAEDAMPEHLTVVHALSAESVKRLREFATEIGAEVEMSAYVSHAGERVVRRERLLNVSLGETEEIEKTRQGVVALIEHYLAELPSDMPFIVEKLFTPRSLIELTRKVMEAERSSESGADGW